MSPLLCTCSRVSEAEVQAAIEAGATSLEAIGEACDAGTGCQTCHEGIELLLAQHRAPREQSRDRRQLSLFGE